MKRNNRINVRLTDLELHRLNDLAATYGDTQSGTFRSLLTIFERQEIFENNQRKLITEIEILKQDVTGLRLWLEDHIA